MPLAAVTLACHPLAARDLRRCWRVHREVAGRHGACTLVARNHDPCRRHAAVDKPERGWPRAIAEQLLAVAQNDWECEQPDLVDQVVGEQRLEQIGAALRHQRGAVLSLRRGNVRPRLVQRDGTPPCQLHVGARRHVFRSTVEPLRDRIVIAALGKRPMRGENFVRLAPEQELEWLAKQSVDGLAELLVDVRRYPAAPLEAARRILLRSAWRLHDAVQRHECSCDDFSHDLFSFAGEPRRREGWASTHCPTWLYAIIKFLMKSWLRPANSSA